ncbi:MAG TPA: DUF1848 family protein [Anaerolineae bacterium]|nr:DUF1848 family protein [Anaerolineae bacterium]
MGLIFKLDDYPGYLERVGGAAYVDLTRRTDPARIPEVWDNLRAVVEAYGAPWIVQVWTKDAAGTLAHGRRLLERLADAGTALAAQVTVTGLGSTAWEPLVPAEPFAGVAEMAALVGGPEHVCWRFDPVIPGVSRLDTFQRLAARAAALGIRRGVVNFLAPPGRYARVDARLASLLPGWREGMPGYDLDWQAQMAVKLVRAACDAGIELAACAESSGLPALVPGLRASACGDHAWFVALSGRDPGRARGSASRRGCGCAAYFDAGCYGRWARCHRCAYCYAG